jgi:hypothetical protein
MILSAALAGAALVALQPDPTRAPREAFTACLHRFVDSAVQARKAADAFTSEFPQQCQAEERAYRQAMVRRDLAARISQADAEASATEEIEWARQNGRESFESASNPRT